jgi:hypothetical protein
MGGRLLFFYPVNVDEGLSAKKSYLRTNFSVVLPGSELLRGDGSYEGAFLTAGRRWEIVEDIGGLEKGNEGHEGT